MRRTKEEAEQTRQALIQAGLEVFSAKGYESAGLEAIARAAGVTRGAVYWHFGGKAGLYTAVIAELTEGANTVAGRAVSEGGSFAEICERVLIEMLDYLASDPRAQAIARLKLTKTDHIEELAKAEQLQLEEGKALFERLTGFMEIGRQQGALRPDVSPEEAARAFLALQNGIILLWLAGPDLFPLPESARSLAQVFVRGVTNSA